MILGLIALVVLIALCTSKRPIATIEMYWTKGWYADPWRPGHWRYYDGTRWTAITDADYASRM